MSLIPRDVALAVTSEGFSKLNNSRIPGGSSRNAGKEGGALPKPHLCQPRDTSAPRDPPHRSPAGSAPAPAPWGAPGMLQDAPKAARNSQDAPGGSQGAATAARAFGEAGLRRFPLPDQQHQTKLGMLSLEITRTAPIPSLGWEGGAGGDQVSVRG